MSPPAHPRCPVCGEGFEAAPARRCERCETPHHAECWEYVPGCAVFGCAEDPGQALSVQDWPEAHALVLRGMRWISAATWALQAVPLAFVLGLGLMPWIRPFWLGFGPFVVVSLGLILAMQRAFAVKHEVQRRGLEGMFAAAEREGGDARLARAITERSGRTFPFPPWAGALLFTGATLAIFGVTDPSGHGPAVLFLGATFYAALKLPTRWVGYQRILANRLGAALEASRPVKPALPPD